MSSPLFSRIITADVLRLIFCLCCLCCKPFLYWCQNLAACAFLIYTSQKQWRKIFNNDKLQTPMGFVKQFSIRTLAFTLQRLLVCGDFWWVHSMTHLSGNLHSPSIWLPWHCCDREGAMAIYSHWPLASARKSLVCE